MQQGLSLTASVTNMLHQLEWTSLQQLCQQAKVILLYEVQNDIVAVPAEYHAHPSNPRALLHCPRWSSHGQRLSFTWHPFCQFAMRLSNTLPNNIRSAISIDVFKALIAQYFCWHHHTDLRLYICRYVGFNLECHESFNPGVGSVHSF